MEAQANWSRSFWALIATQFQGAFSLNAFEYLLLYMVLSSELLHARRDQLVFAYGLLPEIRSEKWLSWGNGILELGTFLAIISGIWFVPHNLLLTFAGVRFTWA